MQRVLAVSFGPSCLDRIGAGCVGHLPVWGADALKVGLIWAVVVLLVFGLIWLGFWLYKRHQANKTGQSWKRPSAADADRAWLAASDKGRSAGGARARMAEQSSSSKPQAG